MNNYYVVMILDFCLFDEFLYMLQSLWFPLLETVMSPQRKLKDLNNKQIQEGLYVTGNLVEKKTKF